MKYLLLLFSELTEVGHWMNDGKVRAIIRSSFQFFRVEMNKTFRLGQRTGKLLSQHLKPNIRRNWIETTRTDNVDAWK